MKENISIYADDATIFVKTELQEFEALRNILELFSWDTGLKVNLDKTRYSQYAVKT